MMIEVILECLLCSKSPLLNIFWPMRWLISLSSVANEIPEYLIIALLIRSFIDLKKCTSSSAVMR